MPLEARAKREYVLVEYNGPYSEVIATAGTLNEIMENIDADEYFSTLNIECNEEVGDTHLHICSRYRNRPWVGIRRVWNEFGPLPNNETCPPAHRAMKREGKVESVLVWGTDKGDVETRLGELELEYFSHEFTGDGNDHSLRN